MDAVPVTESRLRPAPGQTSRQRPRNDDTELAQALILDAHDVSHQAGALQVDGVHRTDSNGALAVERMTTAPPLLL